MKVDAVAHDVGAFRACEHGDAIQYWATLECTGPEAVAAIVAALRRDGHLIDCGSSASRSQCFAVLDMLGPDRFWFDTICIPDQYAFEHIRAALALRIVSSDCDQGCE